jgi:hypothetical protein
MASTLITISLANPGDIEDFPDTRTGQERLWDQEYQAKLNQERRYDATRTTRAEDMAT